MFASTGTCCPDIPLKPFKSSINTDRISCSACLLWPLVFSNRIQSITPKLTHLVQSSINSKQKISPFAQLIAATLSHVLRWDKLKRWLRMTLVQSPEAVHCGCIDKTCSCLPCPFGKHRRCLLSHFSKDYVYFLSGSSSELIKTLTTSMVWGYYCTTRNQACLAGRQSWRW